MESILVVFVASESVAAADVLLMVIDAAIQVNTLPNSFR